MNGTLKEALSRLNFICIILILGVLMASLVNAASTGEEVNVTVETNPVYSDSQEVVVRFDISHVDSGVEYTLDPGKPNYYDLDPQFDCEAVLSCRSISEGRVLFNPQTGADLSGAVTLKFKPKQTPNSPSPDREEDVFDCSLDVGDGAVPCVGGTNSVESGRPSFTVKVEGSVTGEADTDGTSQFGKNEQITVSLIGLFDNSDDGSSNVSCSAKLGTSSILDLSKSFTITSEQNVDLGVFSANNYTTGTYALAITCNDGQSGTDGLDSQVDPISISIIDLPPDVNEISFSKETIYPGDTIKCSATAKDLDDPDSEFTFTYEWWVDSVKKSSTDTLNCTTTNGCTDESTIQCKVKAKNKFTGGQESQLKSKEKKLTSRYSNVAITSNSTIQEGSEETFTASYDYEGTATTTCTWDFGDNKTGIGCTVKHKFADNAEYNVQLTVKDNKGSTGTATKEITVVDPDVVIDIKNPVQNQDAERGSEISVKVQITDNTSETIDSATVTAKITDGNNSTDTVTLKKIAGSAGMYEGKITVPYLIAENPEVEIDASYTKNSVKVVGKKSRVINLVPIELKPEIVLDTEYVEVDATKLSAGNKINKVTVCFVLPDNDFDNQMVSTLKLVLVGETQKEFTLTKENLCYATETDHFVNESVEQVQLKFKDAKDGFGNSAKVSYVKNYDVIPLPEAFTIAIAEPSKDTINLSQKINVKVKMELKDGIENEDLTDMSAKLYYKTETVNLTYNSAESAFVGTFEPDPEEQVTFKVRVEGKYKGAYVAKDATKTLTATNNLKINLISPSTDGIVYQTGMLIFDIKYANDQQYDGNSFTVKINDKNVLLNKIIEGEFAGLFGAAYDTALFKKASYNISGTDGSGNSIILSANLPTLSYKFSLTVYYVFGGILIVLFILIVVVGIILRKQKQLESKYHEKTLEEYQEEKQLYESTLSELKKSLFKRTISEEQFKMQKVELEQKLAQVESKIKSMEAKTLEKPSSDNLMEQDQAIRELISFFIQNQWSEAEIRNYLEKGNVPERTVNYVIARINESKGRS